MNWRSEALFVVGLVLGAIGIFGENWIGTSLSTVTGIPGATLVLAWFYRRGMVLEAPRFVYAQKYLNAGLILLGIGTALFVSGAGLDLISSSSSEGLPLYLAGAAVYIAAIAELIIALATAHPPPIS